jgi:membrane protein YdbS with pleckstrin-like domain
MDETFIWEITLEEQRRRNQEALFRSLPFLALFVISFVLVSASREKGISIGESPKVIFYLLGASLFFFVANKIYPYPKKRYELGADGLRITKGRRERRYLWSEFEYFADYACVPESKDNNPLSGIF